jgi:hypothetical protein
LARIHSKEWSKPKHRARDHLHVPALTSTSPDSGTSGQQPDSGLGGCRADPSGQSLPPCLTGTSQKPVPPATRKVRYSSRAPDGGRNTAKPVARTDVFFKCTEMTHTLWSVWKRSQTRMDTVLSAVHDGISIGSRTTTCTGALPDDSFAPLAAVHMAECGGLRSFRSVRKAMFDASQCGWP